MQRQATVLYLLISVALCVSLGCTDQGNAANDSREPIRALIIDGQNNHPIWPKTTMMIKDYLEQTRLFEVDIYRSAYVWQGPHNSGFGTRESRDSLLRVYPLEGVEYEALDTPRADPAFSPGFSEYDVVISNFGWMAAPWPAATRSALESYVSSGGGFVLFHAGSNPFPDWYEYNRMAGIGGWSGRDSTAGPFVYYNNTGQLVRQADHGSCGAHGPQQDFVITLRDTTHPITKGMPVEWLHPRDELYEDLCGPAIDLTVLATAYSDRDQPGSGNHEPQVLTVEYGEGRVFHTTLGHADYSMECVGFITLLQRGVEWAATGQVMQKIPDDFPNRTAVSTRTWVK